MKHKIITSFIGHLKIWLMIVSLLSPFFALVSCCSVPGDNNNRIHVSPRMRETAIRKTLLEYTPLGSSSDIVLTFVRTRLENKNYLQPFYDRTPALVKDAAGYSARIGKGHIMVFLGLYGINLFARLGTEVQYVFDQENHLVDILVNKFEDSL